MAVGPKDCLRHRIVNRPGIAGAFCSLASRHFMLGQQAIFDRWPDLRQFPHIDVAHGRIHRLADDRPGDRWPIRLARFHLDGFTVGQLHLPRAQRVLPRLCGRENNRQQRQQ